MNTTGDQFPTEYRDPHSIIVPAERQRANAKADEALVDSIRQDGLINPILIHADGVLVAGERRLDAHRTLNKPVRCTVLETLSPAVAWRLELAENLQRKQLTWQEEVKAIAQYHAMRAETVGAAAWTQTGTANELGVSSATVSRALAVAKELGDEEVAGCNTFQAAFNLIQNRAERAMAAAQSRGLAVASAIALALPAKLPEGATKEDRTKALMDTVALGGSIDDIVTSTANSDNALSIIEAGKLAAAAMQVEHERETLGNMVVTADFLDWAAEYAGPKFDVLHCDFPYGKGYKGSNTRRTGKAHVNPTYLDDPDIYFELVDGFLNLQDNFCFPVAHCIFWFDMVYYQWTIDRFKAAGWHLVQPFPLIWTKGYTGVAADTKRRPRHCYETALMFSRGDRKIVQLENDHYECRLDETKLHISQKPTDMLRKFLKLVVDEHTALLDPTCGSGGALAAALMLKAHRVLGVEIDSANAEVARFQLQRKVPEAKEQQDG